MPVIFVAACNPVFKLTYATCLQTVGLRFNFYITLNFFVVCPPIPLLLPSDFTFRLTLYKFIVETMFSNNFAVRFRSSAHKESETGTYLPA
jgi:hypothetical protein